MKFSGLVHIRLTNLVMTIFSPVDRILDLLHDILAMPTNLVR